MTAGLRDNARLLTFIFNNLVLDHKVDCELRKYDSPMAPRNLANEISRPVVINTMDSQNAADESVRQGEAAADRDIAAMQSSRN